MSSFIIFLFIQTLSTIPGPFAVAFLPSSQPDSRLILKRNEEQKLSRLVGLLHCHKTTTNHPTLLCATRERRTSSSSSSSSPLNQEQQRQQQQLITKEEAARQKRKGQAKHRQEKLARMENRISYLESLPIHNCTIGEQKELEGLLRKRDSFEEQYDPSTFSHAHLKFKRRHNEVFVALARYCQQHRLRRDNHHYDSITSTDENYHMDDSDTKEDPKVFYLDGQDCGTSLMLLENGFDPSLLFVANRHLSTCEILQTKLPKENILHCTAAEALTPNEDIDDLDRDNIRSFADIDFSAYYFDGCGGFVPHVIGMMTAALIRANTTSSNSSTLSPKTTAVGYSLMGGNRDVIEKELTICRALTVIARTKGMRIRQVLEDPERFGIPSDITKTEGGTFTSWILLEEGY